jgi:hypothetical protein
MRRVKNVGLFLVAALAACTVSSGQSARTPESDIAVSSRTAESDEAKMTIRASSQAAPKKDADAQLPADACTTEGYWSFFEAFVRSQHVRESHTAASAREGINPFHIALVDDRWYYVEAGKEPGDQPLDLKEARNGDGFRVDYVRAKFGPEDEVVATYGKPGAYVFQFANGCWQLVKTIQ